MSTKHAAVRIELKEGQLTISQLDESQFVNHGFGSFLPKVLHGDVSVNQAAYDFLSQCPSRNGLMAIEVFNGPIIAYGSLALSLTGIGKTDVSVALGAWDQLKTLVIISED